MPPCLLPPRSKEELDKLKKDQERQRLQAEEAIERQKAIWAEEHAKQCLGEEPPPSYEEAVGKGSSTSDGSSTCGKEGKK